MKQPLWQKLYRDDNVYPSLHQNLKTDVLIIGGGMTGLSTAYHLMKNNYRVVVVEANEIGSSASGRNTGKVTAQHGLIYHDLIKKHGLDFANKYYEYQRDAIDDIEMIIKKYAFSCYFERTSTIIQSACKECINKEYEAYQKLSIPSSLEKQENYASLMMLHQAKFQPYAFIRQFAAMLRHHGVELYENSIYKMYHKEDHEYCIDVNDFQIHAKYIVFATQFPIVDQHHFYYTRMIPIQKSIYTSHCYDQYLPFVLVDEPGYSINTYRDYLLLVLQYNQAREMFEEKHFPVQAKMYMDKYDFKEHWTSSDYMSLDKLPYIGLLDHKDSNVYFASGYSQWGNTLGFMAGKIISQLIDGKHIDMFDPHRKTDILTMNFIKENLKTVSLLLKSHFQQVSHELPDIGEGKLMDIQGHTFGVYREDEKVFHVVDVKCPHLGCLCRFHQEEKTWDCPCHGSRFDYTGHIIKGPSRYGLAYIKIEENS